MEGDEADNQSGPFQFNPSRLHTCRKPRICMELASSVQEFLRTLPLLVLICFELNMFDI